MENKKIFFMPFELFMAWNLHKPKLDLIGESLRRILSLLKAAGITLSVPGGSGEATMTDSSEKVNLS